MAKKEFLLACTLLGITWVQHRVLADSYVATVGNCTAQIRDFCDDVLIIRPGIMSASTTKKLSYEEALVHFHDLLEDAYE